MRRSNSIEPEPEEDFAGLYARTFARVWGTLGRVGIRRAESVHHGDHGLAALEREHAIGKRAGRRERLVTADEQLGPSPAQAEHARDRPQLRVAETVEIADVGVAQVAKQARARSEVDGPAVVGVDEAVVGELAALVDVGHAGRDELDEQLRERARIAARRELGGERGNVRDQLAVSEHRAAPVIDRAIEFRDGGWHQLEDTRIPPGESLELAAAWAGGRTADATLARVTVEVHPDDFYEGFYRAKLAAHPPPAEKAQYEAALARATASHYVAETIDVRVTIAP